MCDEAFWQNIGQKYPVCNRCEEFEARQAVNLYRVKAEKAGLIWEETLSGITSVTHRWKWEYMDYLEAIRFKDIGSVTLQEAKKKILTYEEFAEIKDAEEKLVQNAGMVELVNETMSEVSKIALSEENEPELKKFVSERIGDVQKIIDYTKLSIEERAALLPIPTDDYEAEYVAYRERMNYTEEKMKSIRYKMTLYDEFLKEYSYRKKHYGIRDASRKVEVSEKSKGAR